MRFELPSNILNSTYKLGRPEPDSGVFYDVVVIGGGPAGSTSAIYTARKNLKIALLAKDLGGQTAWTSSIENYPGFIQITGAEFVGKLIEQLDSLNVPMLLDSETTAVYKSDECFVTKTMSGAEFVSRAVIVASGKSYRQLGVPGEKELLGHGVAYCAVCDAPFYKAKRVVVVGGGNSAFTAALELLKLGATVTLLNSLPAWQAEHFLIAKTKAYGTRVAMLERQQVLEIMGNDRVTGVLTMDRSNGARRIIDTDGIFIEIGLLPNSGFVKDLVNTNQKDEVIVDCGCATSCPGVFACGDVTTVPHKQIIIAAGEGAKAALSAYEYLLQLKSTERRPELAAA